MGPTQTNEGGQSDSSLTGRVETHKPVAINGGWEATGATCKMNKQRNVAKTEEEGAEVWTEAQTVGTEEQRATTRPRPALVCPSPQQHL